MESDNGLKFIFQGKAIQWNSSEQIGYASFKKKRSARSEMNFVNRHCFVFQFAFRIELRFIPFAVQEILRRQTEFETLDVIRNNCI